MIVVLGIDGLEYDLVEEWDLKYIKQKAYTKTDLSDFGVIITPLIWAAMLTGEKVEGIEKIFLKRARFFSEKPKSIKKEEKQYITAKIAARLLPKSAKEWIIRNVLLNPFEKTSDYLIKKKYRTVFDFFQNPWTNGVPSYGKNVADERVRRLMREASSGHPEILYRESLKLFRVDREKLFEALSRNHDFIFWYTPFLDEMEHFYIHRKMKLLKVYIDLNRMVKEVCDWIGDDGAVYVISDHGMVLVKSSASGYFGEHSDHGFFSSSTGEIIRKPQDLYYLIRHKGTLLSSN